MSFRAYTIPQLAHFNRCLFLDEFVSEISELCQYDHVQKLLLEMELEQLPVLDVLSIYQLKIEDELFCRNLSALVNEFFKRNN